jgi:hypothetical protein
MTYNIMNVINKINNKSNRFLLAKAKTPSARLITCKSCLLLNFYYCFIYLIKKLFYSIKKKKKKKTEAPFTINIREHFISMKIFN